MTETTPEYRIAALSLRPGDTLVAKVDGVLTTEMLNTVGELIRRHVAPDVPVMVLDRRVDLHTLSTEHTQALLDVIAERRRQVEVKGWTPEHDDEHAKGEMARAAACYAIAGASDDFARDGRNPNDPPNVKLIREYENFQFTRLRELWPWEWPWWKPVDRRRDLVKAGALILAEIERLDRIPLPEVTR